MRRSTGIVIAILVVILILIVYVSVREPKWATVTYWKAHLVEDPDGIYRRSGGGYDEEADLALRRTLDRINNTTDGQRPEIQATAVDHLRAATIIMRNILNQEHRPEMVAGLPTRRAREHSRHRRELFAQARGHHQTALAILTPGDVARDIRNRLDRVNETYNPGVAFVLGAAEDFAFAGLNAFIDHDPLQTANGMFLDPEDLLELGGDDRPTWGIAIAREARKRRGDVVDARKTVARGVATEQGGARGAATETYVDLATQHTNDPQNSHDSSVNAALRAIVVRLRRDQANTPLPSLDEIEAEVARDGDGYSTDPRTGRPRPVITDEVRAVIKEAKKGEKNISVDVCDEEALRRVWARASDPRNADRAIALRQAVFDNLADCWSPSMSGRKIVCVNGRTARVLGSLTLLDWDRHNWDVKTLEQYKNDIYQRTHDLIRAEAQRWTATDDPEHQKVGRSYLATTAAEMTEIGDIDGGVEDQFREQTKSRIGLMVDMYVSGLNQTVRDGIPEHAVEGIKTEAMAAIE